MRLTLICLLLLETSRALAADPVPAPAPAPAEAEATTSSATTAALEAVVRGIYLEMRAGLGGMVTGPKLPTDPAFPQLRGQPESMGMGTLVDFALGIDLARFIAIQAVGGVNIVGGQRTDRVRGLTLGFGGLGVRLSVPCTDRLYLVLAPNITYGHADTAVDAATNGLGLLASLGIEYFVHVRHLSVGIDVVGAVPFSPLRVFLGASPHIRYTF